LIVIKKNKKEFILEINNQVLTLAAGGATVDTAAKGFVVF